MTENKARGQRIRQAMAKRKIGKAHALAAELHVSVAAVSRWQNGGDLSLDNACALAETLDISLDWLLLGRGTLDWHRDNLINPRELEWILALRERPAKIRKLVVELVEVIKPENTSR
ncbi:helix-turn-helix transcriptional regulator [Peteryoungia desertarenae]|uniref:Helix-turn-helix transcriptional regulator n=1 Tax=Peteryoungia desertarenae TaxID=1813451 RepID=A0ABX6QMK5_9HYPH|nr:helix-turn-helix transcriptional regulator [Peteryoungia desertarenae]QLF69836.1 helix-turn-helix transcriptional regulator [Peteryoungia desertarenae]